MDGHVRRNHPRELDTLNVIASPEGIRELQQFAADPEMKEVIESLTVEDVLGVGGSGDGVLSGVRRIQGMAAQLQAPRIFAPRKVQRKEIDVESGVKPGVAQLREILNPTPAPTEVVISPGEMMDTTPNQPEAVIVIPVQKAETHRKSKTRLTEKRTSEHGRDRRTPTRIGVRRRAESVVRETKDEEICRQDGSRGHTREPRFVVRETW
jgi:hypothetical protein